MELKTRQELKFQDKIDQFEEFFREQYSSQMAKILSEGKGHIKIDYQILQKFNTELADALIESPEESIQAAQKALENMSVLEGLSVYPRFFNLNKEDCIRIRDLRSTHIGKLISVEGLIKRASEVRPEVVSAVFECVNCGQTYEKEQKSTELKAPYECSNCGQRKFEIIEKKMIDVQVITIEESPEDIEGSEQPSRISGYLRGDLVDPDFRKRVVPGNKVVLTGILKESPMKTSSKRYDLYLEISYLEPKEMEFEEIEISPAEEKEILKLAKNPKIMDKIVSSIAPSIYGFNEIKRAIALQLFSGVRKERPDGTVSRGDIHILLIGEPGTGKSMILKFVGSLAPKGRYVVGKSSTAAGITASVVRDELTGGFALEAGALVLANKGLVGIDEIDKMSSEDRSALHEAMEQQTITVSKANIQATLQARTSILAAGNPRFGRFDLYKPIAEQINISETLLSRFDLIFPIRDIPNKEKDIKLANHILSMHKEPEKQRGVIDRDLLRKYIAYAKRNVKPKITEEAEEEIKKFYIGIRTKKGAREEGDLSVPISARQLEALIRLSEASAKSRLSEFVEVYDAKVAIDSLTYCLKEVGIDPETGEFDIDRIESGITSSQRSRIRDVLDIIDSLSTKIHDAVPLEDIMAEAEEKGIKDVEEIIRKLKQEGELFEPKAGHIQKI